MNAPLRVLLVGRRFWPHGGFDAAGHLIQLAEALQRRGVEVQVLTPRYDSHGPIEFRFREIPVHRPLLAPRSDWSLGRYTRGLSVWLRQHLQRWDVIFCDAIREESLAAIEATRPDRCRVLVRCGRSEEQSDLDWWSSSRMGRRCRVVGRLADAAVAPGAESQRALLAAGYAERRVHRIDPGFAAGPTRSVEAKARARAALAAANADLGADPTSPVLLCAAPMLETSGIHALVGAARPLVARYPRLRLWLVGDGPTRDWIYDRLRGDGVRASIAMPGSFCETDDLLAAADLFLQCGNAGLESWLPAAISAELPLVAVDSPQVRAVIGGDSRPQPTEAARWIQWCAPDPSGMLTSKAVQHGVANRLDDLETARSHAVELRRLLLRTRPQSNAIDAYLGVIRSLVSGSASHRHTASIEAAS